MNESEYNELSTAQHGPWIIPDFFYDEDGYVDTAGSLVRLEEEALISYDSNGFIVITDELRETMPTVAEWLDMIIRDAQQARLDDLVDRGVLSMSIDSRGDAVYSTTGLGEHFA